MSTVRIIQHIEVLLLKRIVFVNESKIMKLDHNDLNLGHYIAENASQLSINVSNLHMVELTGGDGALRYNCRNKENFRKSIYGDLLYRLLNELKTACNIICLA